MSRTMMSSTRTLYFLPGAGTVASAWRPQRATALLPLPRGRAGWGHGDTVGWHSLVVPPAQLGEVGQLLDADDAVVERGLEALGHGVGQDDGDHDGEDVRDLSRQLEDDDSRGHRVGDGARQRGRPCARARPRETQGQPSGARLPARGAVSRTPGDTLGTSPMAGLTQNPSSSLRAPPSSGTRRPQRGAYPPRRSPPARCGRCCCRCGCRRGTRLPCSPPPAARKLPLPNKKGLEGAVGT